MTNIKITKSLFVDYLKFPKLARRKLNNIDTYKKINQMESEEQEEYIVDLWQQVEDATGIFLQAKYQTKVIDLMPNFKQENLESGDDYDLDDIFSQNLQNIQNIEQSIDMTLQAIQQNKKILYQPTFRFWDCFVRADFMVLNDEWNYDLIEVKAKTSIRKTVTDDGEKKSIWEVDSKFINDISFQKYVIDSILKENNLQPIQNTFFAYLNKDYYKNWDINYNELITIDQVWVESNHEIEIIQRWKPVTKIIDDSLLDKSIIKSVIQKIQTELILPESEFNKIHLFPGNKYLEYFWKEAEFGTLMWWWLNANADLVSSLYYQWKSDILSLSQDDKDLFNTKNPPKNKPGLWKAREFIDRYIECFSPDLTKNDHKKIILKPEIKKILNWFKYPICFYDYESINVPIPIMDKTHPYQQVVVQYSLHKYYPDGTLKHFGWILGGQLPNSESRVDQIQIPHNPNLLADPQNTESEKVVYWHYKDLLTEFLKDIWNDINKSTFIVWHKPFENTRNDEIWDIFPDLKDNFLCINENTYDLKEIFSTGLYFDLNFKGSASIKKVLPVLTPISYDNLDVWNGAVAMKELVKLVDDQIDISSNSDNAQIKQKLIQDLLIYCGQDSLAMVEIFRELVKRIG